MKEINEAAYINPLVRTLHEECVQLMVQAYDTGIDYVTDELRKAFEACCNEMDVNHHHDPIVTRIKRTIASGRMVIDALPYLPDFTDLKRLDKIAKHLSGEDE